MHVLILKRMPNPVETSAEIQDEFFQTNFQVNFAGDSSVDFSGHFHWKKEGKSTQNPQQHSNQNVRVSRPKSTLQESDLDRFLSLVVVKRVPLRVSCFGDVSLPLPWRALRAFIVAHFRSIFFELSLKIFVILINPNCLQWERCNLVDPKNWFTKPAFVESSLNH